MIYSQYAMLENRHNLCNHNDFRVPFARPVYDLVT